MSFDSSSVPPPNGEAKPSPGLPTVTPPSGSMFIRLFGVPALIVGGLVLLLIVGQPLLGKFSKFFLGHAWGSSSPEQFLRDLDNSNKEIRWRAANDLAQVLLRDDNLASDSSFALQLAERLRRTLDSSAGSEKAHAERAAKLTPDENERELAKLEPDRDYVMLLTQCLGHFIVPIGAPLLEEMAVQKSSLDPQALNVRRRQALWALANLGENVKRFDAISPERQEAVEFQLESASEQGAAAKWAKEALQYLKKRREGHAMTLGVDRVVEECAEVDDPSLRELAAFVSNFWSGTPAENERIEKALVRLSHDTGKGEDELLKLEEQKPPATGNFLDKFVEKEQTRSLVKKPGFRVQANATIALARRGSAKVRLGLLQTLLDEDELRSIFVENYIPMPDAKSSGGHEQPDQAAVVETMLNALKAVAELHHKNPQLDLSSLRSNIDKLAHSSNAAVQAEAGRVVLKLSKPSP